MIRKLTKALQGRLLNTGIEVRKAPAGDFDALPVFALAVEALMGRCGDALSFVQVGANDGLFVDPLRPYVQHRGWTGILIEPQPLVFEQLKKNYADQADRLIFENIAISADASLTLYLPPEDMRTADGGIHARSVVSSDAGVIARQIGRSTKDLQKITVPAMTLDALLAKHGMTSLDVLQIDAEGYDWAVLQTLNLDNVAPTIIQLETGHLDRPTLSALAEHLGRHDYQYYHAGHQGDGVAVRRGLIQHR